MLNPLSRSSLRFAAIGILLSFFTAHALADKPYWADSHSRQGQEYRYKNQRQPHYHNDKYSSDRYKQERYRNEHRQDAYARHNFYRNDRRLINDYYREQSYKRNCPRGLTRQHNRCQPSRHAKKWHKGQALPQNIKYYTLPQPLHARLQQPPSDYRYVRVDDNVLMVDRVTNVVVDVIENIFR